MDWITILPGASRSGVDQNWDHEDGIAVLGAVGGAGAAAAIFGGAEPAGAANGGSVPLGRSNAATATTSVSTTAGNGLQGVTSADEAGGVVGEDNSSTSGGCGVEGRSVNGTGVSGTTSGNNQSGVYGEDASSGGGSTAKSVATVTGLALDSSSLVLANLQNSLPGVFVEAVVPNVTNHSFQIVLSGLVPAGKTAKVAWFVVN
jgi:hypothetical protein